MKFILVYASLLFVRTLSCKQADLSRAQSIEGTYRATTYNQFSNSNDAITYPINGQQLTLQIKYVSADTVSVQITPSASTTALPTGVYSPTQTLSFPNAYVESTNNTATYIYLRGKSVTTVSTTNPQIWIYSDKRRADYLFNPTQTPNFSKAIRFEKN